MLIPSHLFNIPGWEEGGEASLVLRTPEGFQINFFSSLRFWVLGQSYSQAQGFGAKSPSYLLTNRLHGTESLLNRGQLQRVLEKA